MKIIYPNSFREFKKLEKYQNFEKIIASLEMSFAFDFVNHKILINAILDKINNKLLEKLIKK